MSSNSVEVMRPAKKPNVKTRVRPAHTTNQSSVFTRYIGKFKVAPAEQRHMSLGVYGVGRQEKGFSIMVSPDPDPVDTIAAEILSTGSTRRHELFLSLVNYGDKAVTAEVWGM